MIWSVCHYTIQGHCVTIPLTWPEYDLINLTFQHFSSEQDSALQTWWYSCAPVCLIVDSKTTTAFCVRVFWNVICLICYTTLSFTLLAITLSTSNRQNSKFRHVSGIKFVSSVQSGCQKLAWNPGLSHLEALQEDRPARYSGVDIALWLTIEKSWGLTNCRGVFTKGRGMSTCWKIICFHCTTMLFIIRFNWHNECIKY